MALAVLTIHQTRRGPKLRSNDKKPLAKKMSSKRKQLNRKAIKRSRPTKKDSAAPRKAEETNAE